ncbi:GNAT family N-acetyltransferase [Candidatus Eisenbacteria bacterium]|uniref:GNAT family N-acetyltransferase n=1 Tax=Eiseniibacteriota bacterium TaxID=2212470 RepID=A0ABV6YNX0_UNCEI
MSELEIVRLLPQHREWADDLIRERWGETRIVTRGQIHDISALPGFVALRAAEPVGLATFNVEGDRCEMVSLDSLSEGTGVGGALIEAVRDEARSRGCKRLWLITTNDNQKAVRFYRKRGFRLVAIHKNALDETRKLKPSLPETGIDGIPLTDEIELELTL